MASPLDQLYSCQEAVAAYGARALGYTEHKAYWLVWLKTYYERLGGISGRYHKL